MIGTNTRSGVRLGKRQRLSTPRLSNSRGSRSTGHPSSFEGPQEAARTARPPEDEILHLATCSKAGKPVRIPRLRGDDTAVIQNDREPLGERFREADHMRGLVIPRRHRLARKEAALWPCWRVAIEPNQSSPGGLAQYHGSGFSQFLNTLGRRGNPSVSVMDWACAVITPPNTIAPATMDMIDGFISRLFPRPFRRGLEFGEGKSARPGGFRFRSH